MLPRGSGCGALAIAVLAACGGREPAVVGNHVAPSTRDLALAPGRYPCAFVYDHDTAFGPYRCTVEGDRVAKTDGMEPWSGTLSASPGGVHLDAHVGCGQMTVQCHAAFTVDFLKDGKGTFSGVVTGPKDWWLTGQTLEIRNAGMGGDRYGNALPSGERAKMP